MIAQSTSRLYPFATHTWICFHLLESMSRCNAECIYLPKLYSKSRKIVILVAYIKCETNRVAGGEMAIILERADRKRQDGGEVKRGLLP